MLIKKGTTNELYTRIAAATCAVYTEPYDERTGHVGEHIPKVRPI
jgi:hypothetical protein